ncbi:MAG TPA: hypothetical protein ENJ23_02800 [Bacteroidetes bacterium]|nr:hypothetical protein [Bacteroidota bacterium]
MKLLLLYADRFAYSPGQKSLESAPDTVEPAEYRGAVVAFTHVEEQDRDQESKVVTKLIKNIKWLAGKFNTRDVVLHSFSHLSESKADPEFAARIFDQARERLEAVGYQVGITPFGYVLNLEMALPGVSLARVFKSF